MKLTQDQIEHLYNFTRHHYVEWYDLQTELVDHLANGIEQIWDKNPKLTFEEALQIEFKKFGVFGFMDVVEKRQAVLTEKYYKLVCGQIKDFFSIPKIVIVLVLTLITYGVLALSIYKEALFLSLYSLLILAAFYKLFSVRKTISAKEKLGEKKWLFEEIITQIGGLGGVLSIPLLISNSILSNTNSNENNLLLLGLSFGLVFYSVLLFIIFYFIPAKKEIYLKELYPEYNMN